MPHHLPSHHSFLFSFPFFFPFSPSSSRGTDDDASFFPAFPEITLLGENTEDIFTASRWLQLPLLLALMRQRAFTAVSRAARRFYALLETRNRNDDNNDDDDDDGSTSPQHQQQQQRRKKKDWDDEAWNACALDLVEGSRKHCEYVIARSFILSIPSLSPVTPTMVGNDDGDEEEEDDPPMDPTVVKVLERLAALYVLSFLTEDSGDWNDFLIELLEKKGWQGRRRRDGESIHSHPQGREGKGTEKKKPFIGN